MLDKTKTAMGARCLRSWLERPLLSVTAINRRSSAVAALVDNTIVREELSKLQTQYAAPLVVEACPLDRFFPAEEYHQKYLDKTPGGYCHVPWEEIDWVKTVDLKSI